MIKCVVYNGKTESFLHCSDPKVLKKGQKYAVIAIEQGNWQTNYKLQGVEGEFNSCWFDEVKTLSFPTANLLIASKKPKIGEKLFAYKYVGTVRNSNDYALMETWLTTTVANVEEYMPNIYKVKTKNSLYIVEVVSPENVASHLVVSTKIPEVGKSLEVYVATKILVDCAVMRKATIKEVVSAKKIATDVYSVKTQSTQLLIQVKN